MLRLQSAFDQALSGRGSLVAVVGDPGIGKTALCEQIATYAAIRGGKTLVGHCYEEGSLSLPYLPFIEALRSYVLARDPEGLKQDLGSGAAEVARVVSEVRDRVAVEVKPPSADPDEDRWRLYQALAAFLKNASTVQPLLLIRRTCTGPTEARWICWYSWPASSAWLGSSLWATTATSRWIVPIRCPERWLSCGADQRFFGWVVESG